MVMDFRPDPPAPESNVERWSPKPLPGPFRRVVDVTLDLAQEQLDSMRRLSRVAPNVRSLVKDLGSDAVTARQVGPTDDATDRGYALERRPR